MIFAMAVAIRAQALIPFFLLFLMGGEGYPSSLILFTLANIHNNLPNTDVWQSAGTQTNILESIYLVFFSPNAPF